METFGQWFATLTKVIILRNIKCILLKKGEGGEGYTPLDTWREIENNLA